MRGSQWQTNPTYITQNYDKFVHLVRRESHKNIPRDCLTSYVCGLKIQTKEMYEKYQRPFTDNIFCVDTVELGNALLDTISELQRSKWQDIIHRYYS